MAIPEIMAYRAMSVFLSAMMVFSTVILPLNTVDAHSPIIGRSNTIDVDNDGFEDSQDACLNSTQNWTVYSNYFDIVNYTSNAMEIVGGFDFAIDSQDRLHIVRVQDGYGTGEWYVNYSRYSINETSLNLEYSDLLAGYGVEFGNYLSMVLDSNDSPKIIFTSRQVVSASWVWLTLNFVEWNGSSWHVSNFGTAAPGTGSANYGFHVDMAINDFDEIFITYIGPVTNSWPAGNQPIHLLSRTGNSSEFSSNGQILTANKSGGSGNGHELTIGILNNSPIVYYSGTIYFNGISSFVSNGPDGANLNYNRSRAEIVVDQNNVIHIIGTVGTSQVYSIINSFNHNSSNQSVLDLHYGSNGRGGSIAFDSNDQPHLSYHVTYISPTGDENSTDYLMQYTRTSVLRVNSTDKPFILFSDSSSDALVLMSRTGDPTYSHSDNDGCDDAEDDHPHDSTQWIDSDGDGYGDNMTGNNPDLYPNDSTQWNDTDGDGYGDNMTGNNPDLYPNDSTQWNDTDGDGYGDNMTGNNPDLYPNDSTQWNDTDGDGYGDNLNGTNGDQLPLDPSDWLDFDSDGIGDSSDPDDDNDGYNDSIDVWPFDNCSWFDRDSDGKPNVILQGCETSLIEDGDDDGDTKLDQDDFCPVGEIDWLSGAVTDHDADGCRDDGEDLDDDNDGLNDSIDLCARGHVGWVSNPSADADNDGCHDSIEDNDDDNDGVSEPGDQCPNTPSGVTVDAQGCPLDSDSDGVADYLDNCSNTPSGVIVDTNGCPVDSDGDGTPDYQDSFPKDANETMDSDGDGVGDNSDTFPNDANETMDSDGDGVGDYSDSFPNDANETADSDSDGIGDNSDECQSSDPMDEVESDGCVLKTSTSETSSLVTPTIIGISTGVILLIILAVVLIRRTSGSIEEERLFDQELKPVNSPIEIDSAPEIESQDTNPPESEIGVLGEDGYYWLEWPSANGSWYYRAPTETTWNYFEK